MKFRDLEIGDEFDFIDHKHPAFNSFFDRCVKVSPKKYSPREGKLKDEYYSRIVSLDCEVHLHRLTSHEST